jgi:hypothetical protein
MRSPPALLYNAWMLRSRLARIALALVSVLLCLLVIDRIVLLVLPLGNVVYRLHPDHLLEYIPDSSKVYIHSAENGGDWVRVRFNQRGFRGSEIAAASGRERVLVYGDSFVAAEFTPLAETFVARLGDELSEQTGSPVETINAGVVGSGPDQIARRMAFELRSLAPSLVVVAITSANDFGDLVRNKLYQLEEDGSLSARSPEVGPALAAGLQPSWHARSGWGLLLRAARRGVSMRMEERRSSAPPPRPVAARLLQQAQREYRNAVQLRDPVVRNLFDDQYDADVSLTPRAPSALHKRRLMKAVLGKIVASAHDAGVPLLLVVIPSPIDVTEDHFGMQVDWRRFPHYERSALSQAVVAAAGGLEIPVFDLFAPMRGAEDPAALYFRFGNDHWSSAGQSWAAELVAERILAEGWLGRDG